MRRTAQLATGLASFLPGPLIALASAALCLMLSAPLALAEEGGQAGASDAAQAGSAFYAPDGRLLRFDSSSGSSGSGELRAGAESVMWTEEGSRLMLRYYNAQGRLARIEHYEGKELVSIETRSWAGNRLQSIRREDIQGKAHVLERYDENGLLSLEEAYNGERLRYRESRAYDDEGRVVRISRDEGSLSADGSPALLVERSYAADGRLASEKRYKHGLPGLFTAWSAPGEYTEEHYDAGVLFARVYFSSNKKYREEIIRGGIVVRERVF